MIRLNRQALKWAIALLTGLCLISVPCAVLANAPPPPPMTWIDFQDWNESIDAVQVVACNSKQCTQPKLFAQYGQCHLGGCASPPQAQLPDQPIIRLSCQDKTCLMAGDTDEDQWQPDTLFQLRVRSGDRIRSSPAFTETQTLEQAWAVYPNQEALRVELGNAWEREGKPALHWGLGFVLTLGIECVILSLTLLWIKPEPAVWRRTYVSFGLMHGVTYPLVWTLPFGLLPFQDRMIRLIGMGELLVALLFLGFLYWQRRVKSWKLIPGSLLLLACLHSAVVFISFLFAYGQPLPSTTGISYGLAIGSVEILITVFEAIAFWVLSRGKLSLLRTGVMSVLMNGVSLVIGILAWQIGR